MRKIVGAMVLVLSVSCGGDSADDITVPEGPTPAAGATDAPSATGTDHGTQTYTDSSFTAPLVLGDFFFAPTTIKAPGGADATLELRNEGEATHTFTVESLDVDEELEPGAERTITIEDLGTDTKVVYHCRFHVASGMEGSFSLH